MTRSDSSLPLQSGPCVLLVEGQDDRHVVEHLHWKCFGAKPPFDVVDKEGYSRLCDAIEPELKVPGRQVMGIIVDANDDPESRWRAVTERVRRVRPEIKFGDPAPCGLVVGGEPRIGIWLWPDNELTGEIEDFVVAMIPPDDPVWPLSRRYIESIPAEHRRFSKGKTTRAEVHAWLAVREEPRRMGAAIRTDDLKVDGTLATRFLAWLDRLFDHQAQRP